MTADAPEDAAALQAAGIEPLNTQNGGLHHSLQMVQV